MMQEPATVQHSQDIEQSRREFEVLLAEYKTHHEEVFKWITFSNQAVTWYLGIFGVIGAIIAKDGKSIPPEWILAVVLIASLILFLLQYQFKFISVAHQRYLTCKIRPRIQQLCGDKPVVEWESKIVTYRGKSSICAKWLTKFGSIIIPLIAIVLVWIWYLSSGEFGRAEIYVLGCNWGPCLLILSMIVSGVAVLCLLLAFRQLSEAEKRIAASKADQA